VASQKGRDTKTAWVKKSRPYGCFAEIWRQLFWFNLCLQSAATGRVNFPRYTMYVYYKLKSFSWDNWNSAGTSFLQYEPLFNNTLVRARRLRAHVSLDSAQVAPFFNLAVERYLMTFYRLPFGRKQFSHGKKAAILAYDRIWFLYTKCKRPQNTNKY